MAEGDLVRVSPLGVLVAQCWTEIPELHPGTGIEEFAIMPDHLHGILVLEQTGRATDHNRTLGSVMGSFKSRLSRLARQARVGPDGAIWQRGFHDHVIRSDRELLVIRRYLRENALAVSVPPRIRSR